MTRRTIALGGLVAMLVTLHGNATPSEAATSNGRTRASRVWGGRRDLGLTVGVSTTADGAFLLSATAGALSFRKTVYADGRYQVVVEQGRDRIAFAGSDGRLAVTYGSRSLTLSTDQEDQQPARVRALLQASPALRLFRRLTAELEASGDVTPEILGLRISGAIIGELDGDDGAVRRLGRELRAKFSGNVRNIRLRASCYDAYQALVVQAANQMEECIGQFGVYNPMRQVCAMVWTMQVESAWFSFLSCSAIPLK